MNIVSLSLNKFRNFSSLALEFSPAMTLLVGDNASGKTNILEAIFLLSGGKSFRAQIDKEMIQWEEELGRVKGKVLDIQKTQRIRKPENSENQKIRTSESLTNLIHWQSGNQSFLSIPILK